MKRCDVLVIGGGILGCFAARNLCRWKLSVLLLEAEDDVCRGITRANTAIVYAGYDNKPGSLKAEMTVRANAGFDALCEELDVPFSRCGSLMVSCGEAGSRSLQKKLAQGRANGVPGLRLLTGDEARQLEPTLSDRVLSALCAPTTGTVNPWQLGIAACENAVHNGCTVLTNTPVTAIRPEAGGYIVESPSGSFFCRFLLNCAGLRADQVQEFLFPAGVRLRLDGADFLVTDKSVPKPRHIIFCEEESGKSITAVPCVEGNLLLDSPPRPLGVPYASTRAGMDLIRQIAAEFLPGAGTEQVIRSFGAVRPNPFREDGKQLHDFCIERPAPNFVSLIGIKTPGLTCANELGMHLAQLCAEYLCVVENHDFDPRRQAISPDTDPEIVCQCEHVTRGQILQAIRRGAVTVDGIKRRVGSGMGSCQGSRCTRRIEELLEEYRHGIH